MGKKSCEISLRYDIKGRHGNNAKNWELKKICQTWANHGTNATIMKPNWVRAQDES